MLAAPLLGGPPGHLLCAQPLGLEEPLARLMGEHSAQGFSPLLAPVNREPPFLGIHHPAPVALRGGDHRDSPRRDSLDPPARGGHVDGQGLPRTESALPVGNGFGGESWGAPQILGGPGASHGRHQAQ